MLSILKQPFLVDRGQSIVIANIIIHFDNALYGYLLPMIAPLFFPNKEIMVQLILGHSLLLISFVAKPFGVLFFSRMAQLIRETVVLRYTFFGAGVGLITIGCLPTDLQELQLKWSIVLLLFSRLLIEACSAGAHTIAKIYLLKEVDTEVSKKLSVLYECTTMIGILLAGGIAALFAVIDHAEKYWRLPFVIAGLLTFLNLLFFRLGSREIEPDLKTIALDKRKKWSTIYLQLWKERKAIVRIAIATGFSYVTYAIPFIFMNGFVPMISPISYPTMMKQLPFLMLFDLLLCGLLHKICHKYDHNNLMAVASGLIALSIMPLFGGLSSASICYVTAVRCWIIFLGVIFSAFLMLWSKEQLTVKTPYLTIGFATALGSSLFGKPVAAICFYLFYWNNSAVVAVSYVALLAFITAMIMASSASE